MTGEDGLKPCPACGEAIRALAKKCRYCGEWLERELGRQRRRHGARPERVGWDLPGLVLGVLLVQTLVVGVCGLLNLVVDVEGPTVAAGVVLFVCAVLHGLTAATPLAAGQRLRVLVPAALNLAAIVAVTALIGALRIPPSGTSPVLAAAGGATALFSGGLAAVVLQARRRAG